MGRRRNEAGTSVEVEAISRVIPSWTTIRYKYRQANVWYQSMELVRMSILLSKPTARVE